MTFAMPAAMHRNLFPGAWWHAGAANGVLQPQATTCMRCAAQEMDMNEILEVKQPLGLTIECLFGSIWVTLDGDARDVVLDAGQAFIVDRQQRTLIQALEAARVRFVEPTCVL